jgi:hypothetical protein
VHSAAPAHATTDRAAADNGLTDHQQRAAGIAATAEMRVAARHSAAAVVQDDHNAQTDRARRGQQVALHRHAGQQETPIVRRVRHAAATTKNRSA